MGLMILLIMSVSYLVNNTRKYLPVNKMILKCKYEYFFNIYIVSTRDTCLILKRFFRILEDAKQLK